MTKIKDVGIIGFGVMGAAIGLNAAMAGYNVIFKELNHDLIKIMYKRGVEDPLKKRVLQGKISQKDVEKIYSRITGTVDYDDLSKCDLIIEAAIENRDSKIKLFNELSKRCSKNTIIVSNTSTFPIEELMVGVSNPSRTAGLHYFFPANVNRLVEVIRQKYTSKETFESLTEFAKNNGKIAISVKDFPGFAINPIFISSYMVLNSFYNNKYNVATLDAISKIALGVKFGIMWVQNGSGLSTCYHAAKSMNDYLGNTDMGYPVVPFQLEKQAENNTPWNLKDGEILKDEKLLTEVKEYLLGTIFTVSTHLIEKEIIDVSALELGICTALAWPKGPFGMMNDFGMKESSRLVSLVVKKGYFKMPKIFSNNIPQKWEL